MSVLKAARRLYYDLVLAPRGYGNPVATTTWDRQYCRGDWDHLYSIDEIGHYMIVVGYIGQLSKSLPVAPSILDVGCGQGRLLELLPAKHYSSFLGLDLSREAIAKAKSIGAVNAEFTVANFEQWQPDRRFDIIVFNESLCYAQRPAEVSLRYADWLTAPGSIIVSLCRYGNHGQIWQNLQAQFAMMTSTRVENNQQQSWDVRIMQRQKNRLEPAL